jgi:hypothetical protein
MRDCIAHSFVANDTFQSPTVSVRQWSVANRRFQMSNEVEAHIIRKYDIQTQLGKGAYGIVWKAIDRKTKQVVA